MRSRQLQTSVRFFFGLMILTSLFVISTSQAQTFTVLHDFTGGTDGGNPLNGLLLGPTGYMYGTTNAGGASNAGAVFRMTSTGKIATLYSFTGGTDGANPQSFLIRDKYGNLYGTTSAGGAFGAGTVFKVTGTKETVLYSFGEQANDGSLPVAGLAVDALGNLYGTTTAGGLYGGGTVFELVKGKNGAWSERVLYHFGASGDGTDPVAGVTLDAAGNVYGTTAAGGASGLGRVFELSKSNAWAETVIHDFQDLDDGAVPYAGLISDHLGNFYGAATEGGSQGGGTVFELTPSQGTWNFSVISSLPGWGISGTFRNVLMDSAGTIYATTHCDGSNSAGTVYQLVPSAGTWNYTLLYTFTGGSDGQFVFSNLVLKGGNLYGTTNIGGTNGYGVVFKVTP